MEKKTLTESIRLRYEETQSQIANSARIAGRDPESVKLVVVTKKQPLVVLQSAINAGVKVFGENYPKEAVSKMQSLGEKNTVEWHMIGHVQSRKASLVVENFSLLHSLDRLKIARRLDRLSKEAETKFPLLLELNVGGEESKHGWDASDESHWDALLPDIEEALSLANLEIRGLMTMPPFFQDAELARPYFQQLRRLRDFLSKKYPQSNFEELSMGTSGDFQIAVQEGATIVRVGQAIVGQRSY